MEDKNRAQRRREQKEGKDKGEGATGAEDYGPAAPRTFDKCPVCGCPARFTVDAMKGDLQIEDIFGKSPALGSFEYRYDTPLYPVRLVCIVDSCVRCGVIYTLARDKIKGQPKISIVTDPRGRWGGP